MTFYITYRAETKKIVQAVVIDNRIQLGIQGQNGNVIQPYVDNQVLEIGSNPAFYAIMSNEENLCGYFSLTISGNNATLQKKNYRPQYAASFSLFDSMIAAFIAGGIWEFDTLK